MAKVFLSYARKDSPRARSLAAALEKDGHTIWWDEQVPGGDQFTPAIQEALDKANAVVVAWSKTSVQSAWVRDEAAYGRDRGKLVPVSLDGSLPPLGFREYQSIDFSSWSGRPSSRQIEALKKAISAKASEDGRQTGYRPTSAAAAISFWSKRRWAIAAVTAALLALAGLIAGGVIDNPVSAQEPPSVAVLPFADLSPGHDKAYFAEGVAEEISSTLATQKDIKVLGRTSARQIERDADPKSVRHRLGVTHLLEGSARSAGDQLRVNVRLIDTSDGRQVWEEKYEGRPADIFAVQDQIAGAVVQRVRGTLLQRQVRSTQPTDAQTYQTYLAARALARTRTQKGLQDALALALSVVRRDANYAPGHALVAELYYLLSDDFGAYGTMPIEQARRLGIPHAQRAIRLAPNLADGYGALALNLAPRGVRYLERAIELDPSRAEFRVWLGFALNDVGRHDEALVQDRAAAEIDPLGLPPVTRYAQALAAAGRTREATNVVRQFVARGGDQALANAMMIQVVMWDADPSGVIFYGRQMLKNEPVRHQYFRLFFAAALNALGEGKQAASVLLPMQKLHASYYSGDMGRLRRTIAAMGPRIWNSIYSGFAFVHLARLRDWNALTELYDKKGLSFAEFCSERARDGMPFVLALRANGRLNEAKRVLECLHDGLAADFRNKARHPISWPGDLELRRASYSALISDRRGVLHWLDRAVARGWMGQPYSSRLTDYPQFDGIRMDPRFAALQRRVDANIARERAELAAQEKSARPT